MKRPSFEIRRDALRAAIASLLCVVILSFTGTAAAQTNAELKAEINLLKSQMQKLQKTLDTLLAQQAASTASATGSSVTGAGSAPAISVPQSGAGQAGTQFVQSVFNPAISASIDSTLSSKRDDNSNFELRSAELWLGANIDPFTRGFATIVGSDEGLEVEEATIETISLPYNIALRGGRLFADFGRLSKFHDHDLPFVNRPVVLDEFMSGESQGDGAELSYLLPISHYVNLTLGAYNKLGAENERTDTGEPRGFNEFTYLSRGVTYADITDSTNVELGGSVAYTPEIESEDGSARVLGGIDLTLRYLPPNAGQYRGLVWGTEILFNREDRPVGVSSEEGEEAGEPTSFDSQNAYGLYSYIEARFKRRWTGGFLFDYAEDLNGVESATKGYSPYISFYPSEFQRLRLQYTRLDGDEGDDDQFFLQWTAFMGSHAHGFRDR